MRIVSRILLISCLSLAAYGQDHQVNLHAPGAVPHKIAGFNIHQGDTLDIELMSSGELPPETHQAQAIPSWQYFLTLLQTLGTGQKLLFRVHLQKIDVLVEGVEGGTPEHLLTIYGNTTFQQYFKNPGQAVALLLNEGLVVALTEALAGSAPSQTVTFNTLPPVVGTTAYFPIDALLGLNLVTPVEAAAVTQHNATLVEDCAGGNQACTQYFILATIPHNVMVPSDNLLPTDIDFLDEMTGEIIYQ